MTPYHEPLISNPQACNTTLAGNTNPSVTVFPPVGSGSKHIKADQKHYVPNILANRKLMAFMVTLLLFYSLMSLHASAVSRRDRTCLLVMGICFGMCEHVNVY